MQQTVDPGKTTKSAADYRAEGYIKVRGTWTKPVRIVTEHTGLNRHERRSLRKPRRPAR